MHISNDEQLGRRSNYIEDPKTAEEKQIAGYFGKSSNQSKGSKKCSKIKRELPKVHAQSMTLHFNMACTTWNPHSLLDNVEHKPKKM